ncbi:hypothetical protein IID20_05130 [Patescibacteria group bacterium]|nr:hypothetical protein [Patescibacteria group bacterium]
MGFTIDTVERDKDNLVESVVVLVNNHIEISFRWANNKPEEVSRTTSDNRLYSREKLRINDLVYRQLIKQVWGIFYSNRKTKGVSV